MKFEVTVSRIASRTGVIEVEADSQAEAANLAIIQAPEIRNWGEELDPDFAVDEIVEMEKQS